MPAFVGRSEPLARLTAAYRACTGAASASTPIWPGLVLVTGEAGLGKTALLTRFTQDVAGLGATVAWGTCWDGDQAPAWWPWSQALGDLLVARPELRADLAPEVDPLVSRSSAPPHEDEARARIRMLDGVDDLLTRAGFEAPLVVVLDDLQWADASSLELLRFLVRRPRRSPLVLACAYRPDELSPSAAAAMADLAAAAEIVPLQAMTRSEVRELVTSAYGESAAGRWAQLVHTRSGGHPFFARELCHLIAAGDPAHDVPRAVRDAVLRRLDGVSPQCLEQLTWTAVAGPTVRPALLADLTGVRYEAVLALLAEAVEAGVLVASPETDATRFTHDLYRETLQQQVPAQDRAARHLRVGHALAARRESGAPVFAAELARHFVAAVPAGAAIPAVAWAREAASEEAQRFAFAEAAGHLAKVRTALGSTAEPLDPADVVGLLRDEADLRLRGGDAGGARALLDEAWAVAAPTGRGEVLGPVALGLEGCGARFAMPRLELVTVLERSRDTLLGSGTALEAQVTAALARQLAHSVPADRPASAPLAEAAVQIARETDDPVTLASSLLALHDALWTPGTAVQRTAIVQEITDLARRAGDVERLVQALLLLASAQLESGSPAFRATATEYEHLASGLHQPRHDYVVLTRRAALALLDGDIERGDALSLEAVALGEAAGDTDTGNVRMSQRLEIVRARHVPEELCGLASEAVAWWVGTPVHAHAVAAGFRARGQDLVGARRELDVVGSLEWRSDRSYLRSVFLGEIATAAIAVGDAALCAELLTEIEPLGDACAMPGALVAFMGSHAHTTGLLHAALGDPTSAREALGRAVTVHRRLGARLWEQESQAALTAIQGKADHDEGAAVTRAGDLWEVSFRGRTAHVRDSKGVRDLAALMRRPGVDIPALDLAGSGLADAASKDPTLDRTALLSYRRRVEELDADLEEAERLGDLGREDRAVAEREALLEELRKATRPDGTSRGLGSRAGERARKAVSARIRDAIRRIGEVHPELGAHLDRSVVTGTACRYEPRD